MSNQAEKTESDGAQKTESDSSNTEELVADLAGRREELQIVIHDLDATQRSLLPTLVALEVSLLLLLGSIGLVVAPYLRPGFPEPVSTIAAFVSVILVFVSYLAFRRFSAEYEHRRLHRIVLSRATYLDRLAGNLLKEAGASESSSTEG